MIAQKVWCELGSKDIRDVMKVGGLANNIQEEHSKNNEILFMIIEIRYNKIAVHVRDVVCVDIPKFSYNESVQVV